MRPKNSNKSFVLYCGSCRWTCEKNVVCKNMCPSCARKLFIYRGTDTEVDAFIDKRLWP